MATKRRKIKRKKRQYSKMVIVAFTILVFTANIASYVLAAFGLEPNSEVTVGINVSYGVVLMGYFGRTAFDHWAMDKYNLEEE